MEVDCEPPARIMRQWRGYTTDDATVAVTAQRDSRTGRFRAGNRCGFAPGRSGNPSGRPYPEKWVAALRAVATLEAVLDPKRIARALDGLAARYPRLYLRLMEQMVARKLGNAPENVPKTKRRRRQKPPVL
ncbi:hypothetical protein LCGC14_1315610 [marine sediment metagenome]|uniref:DUF5681 domain-containing protein n=1 Tax=marine sediment metagenome TaxID=412755 RepID=A0A0F9KL51_9ZZZZ